MRRNVTGTREAAGHVPGCPAKAAVEVRWSSLSEAGHVRADRATDAGGPGDVARDGEAVHVGAGVGVQQQPARSVVLSSGGGAITSLAGDAAAPPEGRERPGWGSVSHSR
jgi:hypothetical protein